MFHRPFRIASLALSFLLVALVAITSTASPGQGTGLAASPVSNRLSYQGQLSDSSGALLSGTYNFRFELYATATGGSPMWQQTVNNVSVQSGLFTVYLDSSADLFDGSALWLDITVNGQRLTPRQELLPSPYAMTLRPGAVANGDQSAPILDLDNQSGSGLRAYGAGDHGIYGETGHDEAYAAAGVAGHSVHIYTAGVMGTSESGFGVYGQITDPGNLSSAVIGYNEGLGRGVSGYSLHNVGVYGNTSDDSEYEAAGVHGHSTEPRTFGVLGTSDQGVGVEGSLSEASNDSPAVVGYHSGAGVGVLGISSNSVGVSGSTAADWAYGGEFINEAQGGAGLRAQAGGGWNPDLVLGGSTGTIYSEEGAGAGDMKLYSQSWVTVDLDDNDDEGASFGIYNSDNDPAFVVDEDGNAYVTGDLILYGATWTKGPVCWAYDVSSSGQYPVAVPDFCLDALCWITVESDGTFGAFGEGFSWPVTYMQYSTSNDWMAGPNVSLAGVSLGGGPGRNGNGASEYLAFYGQTTGGGLLTIWDDKGSENASDRWTVELQTRAGELTWATVYACPMGQPVQWNPGASALEVPQQ